MYLYTLFNLITILTVLMGDILTIYLICYCYFLTIFNLFGQYYIHYLLSIFNKLGCILTIYYLFLNYSITIFELFIDYFKLCLC
jgi:hypothetical protein